MLCVIIFLVDKNSSILKNHILVAARATAITFKNIEKLFLWFQAKQLEADLFEKGWLIERCWLRFWIFPQISSQHSNALISVFWKVEIKCFRSPKGEKIIFQCFSWDTDQLSWLIKSTLHFLALGRVEVPAHSKFPRDKDISTALRVQMPTRWRALCSSWIGATPLPLGGLQASSQKGGASTSVWLCLIWGDDTLANDGCEVCTYYGLFSYKGVGSQGMIKEK